MIGRRLLGFSVAGTIALAVSNGCGGTDVVMDSDGGGTDGSATDVANGGDGTLGDGSGGDGSGGDGALGDGALGDGAKGDASGDGNASDAPFDAIGADGCVGSATDPNNCGRCGNVCPAGQFCSNYLCTCPQYQTACNGVCMVTSVDPNNCGACGHVCPVGQACSAGVCSGGCTPPPSGGNPQIIKCGQLCIDKFNDDKNCGGCAGAGGTDCTLTNKVCAGGTCVTPTGGLDAGGKSCPGGGPPIVIDTGATQTCAGTLAQTTFRWGMCSCGNVSVAQASSAPALSIDGYDSATGPWDPTKPQLGGSLGVNGSFASTGGSPTVFVGGFMWGASTITAAGPTAVKQELHAVGPVSSPGAFDVGQPTTFTDAGVSASYDGYVIGNITAAGGMKFWKDLYVPQAGSTRTGTTVVGTVKTTNPDFTVPPPCDACGSAQVPVSAIVAHYAIPANNDNALVGLSASSMSNLGATTTRLDLPCGYYFLDSIKGTGSITVYAHGHTALFINGDVEGGVVSFVLDPTGSFDVFIKGTIKSNSDLVLGNPNYAALSRTYVGASTMVFGGEQHVAGLLYAANADINLTSHLTVYGALYTNSFTSSENTDIHYDRAALNAGVACPPPPTGSMGDAGADASADAAPVDSGAPIACTSCKDCSNQACLPSGTCGACTSSAQCCAPLSCIGGTCRVPF